MKVDLDKYDEYLKWREQINLVPFKNLKWIRGDKEVVVSAEVAEEWRFVGMSNFCFPEYGMDNDEVIFGDAYESE